MRKALTATALTATIATPIMGMGFERSPITEAELKAFGLSAEARTMNWSLPWHKSALMGVKTAHPVFITGTSGCGKDYAAEALAFQLGRPLVCLSIKPDLDPNEWVGGTSLKGDGVGGTESVEEEGFLARACRGYEIERAGRKIIVPALILISDFDRATPRQAEVFRQAFEEEGRRYLTHPTSGAKLPIADGTIFVLTANSGIDGDGGKGMVASQLDTSIVNRCVGVYAPAPTPAFFEGVLTAKYSALDKGEIKLLVKALFAVKSAIEDANLAYEVSLRTANMVAKMAIMLKAGGASWQEALRDGFSVVQGFCHEADNRALIEGALDPILGSAKISAGSAI
jgi:MoxR-like ATPase